MFIEGRVQGVCFRMMAQEAAEKLGLTGWVRNGTDGRVEILVQGNSRKIAHFVDWCHKGPPHAQVQQVTLEKCSIDQPLIRFEIK